VRFASSTHTFGLVPPGSLAGVPPRRRPGHALSADHRCVLRMMLGLPTEATFGLVKTMANGLELDLADRLARAVTAPRPQSSHAGQRRRQHEEIVSRDSWHDRFPYLIIRAGQRCHHHRHNDNPALDDTPRWRPGSSVVGAPCDGPLRRLVGKFARSSTVLATSCCWQRTSVVSSPTTSSSRATRTSSTGPPSQAAYCSGAATNRWWHAIASSLCPSCSWISTLTRSVVSPSAGRPQLGTREAGWRSPPPKARTAPSPQQRSPVEQHPDWRVEGAGRHRDSHDVVDEGEEQFLAILW
jgi:hypothetical protein